MEASHVVSTEARCLAGAGWPLQGWSLDPSASWPRVVPSLAQGSCDARASCQSQQVQLGDVVIGDQQWPSNRSV